MTKKATGWTLGIAAMAMMCSLISNDVAKLATWHEVFTPSFISVVLAHLGAVGMAFIGGKLIPTSSDNNTNK